MQPCLDATLQYVWAGMRSMPPGMVLIGSTAIALYFNHRASTDLVWLDTSNSLNETAIYRLTAFDDVAELELINGGEGAVDCVLRPKNPSTRTVTMKFIEPDGRFVPEPTQPPVPALDNEVLVAHPIDLARMKTMALFSRRELCDYMDVAAFADREPRTLLRAIDLITSSKTINERHLIMALASPPESILDSIPTDIQTSFESFVITAFQSIATVDRGRRDATSGRSF